MLLEGELGRSDAVVAVDRCEWSDEWLEYIELVPVRSCGPGAPPPWVAVGGGGWFTDTLEAPLDRRLTPEVRDRGRVSEAMCGRSPVDAAPDNDRRWWSDLVRLKAGAVPAAEASDKLEGELVMTIGGESDRKEEEVPAGPMSREVPDEAGGGMPPLGVE